MIRHTAFVILLALGPMAVTHAGTPGADQRQAHQERRIVNGVQSGELTARETRTLAHQQARIDAHEARAKSDGVVTGRERARLHVHQDRASRAIHRKKHNGRDRG